MDRIAEVRRKIVEAFDGVPVPEPENIIIEPTARDQSGAYAIRAELSGKHWRDLSPEFLEARWSAFCYLSAQAFQHYLPAMLLDSLDRFGDPEASMYSTLSYISPSAHAIYYAGGDRKFDRKTALLTDDQFAVVATFLSLFLKDEPDARSFFAAQSFRWGWNRIDTPVRPLFDEFQDRMHHWIYPGEPAADVAPLIAEIRNAFRDTPYPGDRNLSGSRMGDEAAEIALNLQGVTWQEANPTLLRDNSAATTFLTPEGLKYFLPAFMVAGLMGYTSKHIAVHSLTHGFVNRQRLEPTASQYSDDDALKTMALINVVAEGMDWHAYAVERMSGYNRRERQAIIHYLEHCAQPRDYRIYAALENYWRPSLATAPDA